MEITNKVRKLIYGIFDRMIEGSDKYITDNSMWLIFTEKKRWIIEFTNEKTLWFNFNIFQYELNLLSMDCVESKDIIKEWFESRFLGIEVEDTIQNGVKDTNHIIDVPPILVKNAIQNGVKEVERGGWINEVCSEEVIQNGIKE